MLTAAAAIEEKRRNKKGIRKDHVGKERKKEKSNKRKKLRKLLYITDILPQIIRYRDVGEGPRDAWWKWLEHCERAVQITWFSRGETTHVMGSSYWSSF